MTFSNGDSEMDLSWIPAKDHDVRVDDRRRSAQKSWNMTIAGRDALLFRYEGTTDFTALWREGDRSLPAGRQGSGSGRLRLARPMGRRNVQRQQWTGARGRGRDDNVAQLGNPS